MHSWLAARNCLGEPELTMPASLNAEDPVGKSFRIDTHLFTKLEPAKELPVTPVDGAIAEERI
jgi:hypothetical protein